MLKTISNPAQLYARVDLDARIEGSSGQELTGICFDALKSALEQAALASQRANRREAIAAIIRATTVLGGLQRAVKPDAPMGDVLIEFYSSISVRLRDAMRDPQDAEIYELRRDVVDVAEALMPKRKVAST